MQQGEKQRSFGWAGRLFAFMTALAVVVILVGGGGYIASRQLYFLGTNGQGTVVVYRGFPYVPAVRDPDVRDLLRLRRARRDDPASRRAALLNHAMRDQNNAISLVNDVELGKIVG